MGLSSGTLASAKFAQLAQNLVVVVAHGRTSHGEEEIKVGKEIVKRCEHYPTISCEDHQRVYEQARGAFPNVRGTPTTVLATPDGKELARVVGNDGAGVMNEIARAVKRVGVGIPSAAWQKVLSDIAKADAYLEAGKPKNALTVFTKYGRAKIPGLKKMGEEGLSRVNDKGLAVYAEALALEDDKAAVKAMKKIATNYRGTEAADKAKAASKDIKKAREEG